MTRQITHSFVKALRAVPDFEDLDDRTLLKICGASSVLYWPSGRLIFEQGSPGDALYIVMSGAVRIFDSDGGGEDEITVCSRGDYFGELSLMRNTTHSKGARSLEGTELMVVPRGSFEALLESDPDLAAYFRRLFEERAAALEVDRDSV